MARLLSAAVLVAILGAVLFVAPWWGAVCLAAVVSGLAAWEVAGLSAAVGAPISRPVVVTAAVVLCAAMALTGDLVTGGPLAPVLLALIIGAGAVTLGSGPPSPATVTRAAMLVMAPVYVGIPLGAMAWVHVIYGPLTLLVLVSVITLSDTAQYVCGRAVGRRKLAPSVSPGKTIEGAVGGLVVATATGAALAPVWIYGTTWMEGAAIGLVLAVVGIAGDLFESLLKRSAGVKDSSALIPGHGGVLDRVDAYLFAGPVFVLFLRYGI